MPRLPPPGGARARGGKWETFLRAVRAAGSGSGVSAEARAPRRATKSTDEDPASWHFGDSESDWILPGKWYLVSITKVHVSTLMGEEWEKCVRLEIRVWRYCEIRES